METDPEVIRRRVPLKRTPIVRRTPLSRGGVTRKPPGPTARRRATKKRVKDRQYRLTCEEVDRIVGLICELCRAFCRYAEHHHRIMRSRGGQDTVENVFRACKLCHDRAHGDDRPGSEVYEQALLLRKPA